MPALRRRFRARGTWQFAANGVRFTITLSLQEVRGYSALTAGLFPVPVVLVMAYSAPLCGRVIAAHGHHGPAADRRDRHHRGRRPAHLLAAAPPAWCVLLSCVVLGAGMGWVNTPVNNAVAGMPRFRAGTASGIASTSWQVGSSLGVAVSGPCSPRSCTAPGHGLRGRHASGLADRGDDGGTPPGRCDGRAPRGRQRLRCPRHEERAVDWELGEARSRRPSPRT
jgi:hypothetical protein